MEKADRRLAKFQFPNIGQFPFETEFAFAHKRKREEKATECSHFYIQLVKRCRFAGEYDVRRMVEERGIKKTALFLATQCNLIRRSLMRLAMVVNYSHFLKELLEFVSETRHFDHVQSIDRGESRQNCSCRKRSIELDQTLPIVMC